MCLVTVQSVRFQTSMVSNKLVHASFFFDLTADTVIYTLSLHDALPISGRVQQTYKHSVPRFFVPEHGTMFTLAQEQRNEIGRAVQQECRDRSRMPSSA